MGNHIDHYLGTNFGDEFVLDNIIDGVIAFANGDVSPDEDQFVRPFGADDPDGPVYLSRPRVPTKDNWLTADRALAVEGFRRELQEARDYSISVLDTCSKGMGALTEFLKTYKVDEADGDVGADIELALYPAIRYDNSGHPRLGWYISGPSDHKKWCKIAALLLADKMRADDGKRSNLSEIGRCHLKGCGRFFRIKSNGRGSPSRKYCPYFGDDPKKSHMELAHKLTATRRSQEKRQRDAEERKKKKPKRARSAK